MSQEKEKKLIIPGRKMSRQEVIEAVTEPDSVQFEEKQIRTIAIPTGGRPATTNVESVIQEMGVEKGSLMYQVVKLFCDKKKASPTHAKVFILRVRNLNSKQLKVVGLLCSKPGFRVSSIMKAIQSIRKFDGPRLLALRAFIDLEGIDPGFIRLFFSETLPQTTLEEAGRQAYEAELKEKLLTTEQYNVFYSICSRIPGILPTNALSLLRKIRNLKSQHAKVINAFLKKESVFGDKAIDNDRIPNLINLWLTLPEMEHESNLSKFIKRVSRSSDKQRDFKFIVQSFLKAKKREQAAGKILSFFRKFFG